MSIRSSTSTVTPFRSWKCCLLPFGLKIGKSTNSTNIAVPVLEVVFVVSDTSDVRRASESLVVALTTEGWGRNITQRGLHSIRAPTSLVQPRSRSCQEGPSFPVCTTNFVDGHKLPFDYARPASKHHDNKLRSASNDCCPIASS